MVELVVAMAIVSILVAAALPGMSAFLSKNKLVSLTNELLGTMTYARSEAVTRATKITVCRVADATATTPSCAAAATSWATGMMVFVDASTSTPPQPANAAAILRIVNAVGGNYTVVAASSIGSLSFGAAGVLLGVPAGTSFLISSPGTTNVKTRRLCIAGTGRVQVVDGTCT